MVRSTDDQWDIVTGVGFTALMVSAFRAMEATRVEPLVKDDFARLFVQASRERRLIEALDASGDEHNWELATVCRVNHLAVRTKYFDDFVLDAAAAGTTQVVLLAAGLDTRAYRLRLPNNTTVYEVDLPKVLGFKEAVLAQSHARPTARRQSVAADLRGDWMSALKVAGFDPNLPTAWLAEGLLSYLPGTAHDALFETITATAVSGSRLATEWRVPQDDSTSLKDTFAAVTPRFISDVDMGGLTYADERRDPIDWLRTHGWTIEQTRRIEQAAAYGRPVPPGLSELATRWFEDAEFVTAFLGPSR
jgi:methyltransferase (TIGR00027 family)